MEYDLKTLENALAGKSKSAKGINIKEIKALLIANGYYIESNKRDDMVPGLTLYIERIKGNKVKISTASAKNTVPSPVPSPVNTKENKMSIRDEIKQLEQFLKKHQEKYNNKAAEIDDITYDAAFDKLQELDPLNPLINEVGEDNSSDFAKVKHIMPMNSQQKARNLEEFAKWYKKGYAPPTNDEDLEDDPVTGERKAIEAMIVSYKLDGLSVELQYVEGRLTRAVTRGTFKLNTGDDITINARKMQGVVPVLAEKFTGAVRGEIIMDTATFQEIYKPQGSKNPRNAAVGITKQPNGNEYHNLQILVYDVYTGTPEDFPTEDDKQIFLDNNFDFRPNTYYVNTLEQIAEIYENILAARQAGEILYEIDGIVIKPNIIDYEDIKREKPMSQIALKFPAQGNITTLLAVEWSFKGSIYTPVAIVAPVVVSGSTITRASLANPEIMAELGLRIGSKVMVVKRGDVIPKIENVVEIGDGKTIVIPTICEVCDSELIFTPKKLYCANPDCSNKLLHQLHKWIDVLNIMDFGDGLVNVLYNEQIVNSISDFYLLTVPQISELQGAGGNRIGEKNATKALNNLNDYKEIPLSKFIAGFDIPIIGEKIIELLINNGIDTLKKVLNANKVSLMEVKGIGEIKANALIEGLKKNREEIDNLLNYVTIALPVMKDVPAYDNNGEVLSVVFTGSLKSMTQGEAGELVIKKGGVVKDGISRKISYLVRANPTSKSAKSKKAEEFGIPIIDEDEFLRIFS